MNEGQEAINQQINIQVGERIGRETEQKPPIHFQEWLKIITHTHSRLTFDYERDLRESSEFQN